MFDQREKRTPKVRTHDLKMLEVDHVVPMFLGYDPGWTRYNFESVILRTEQHERTIIVVTDDRRVRVLVNAGIPEHSEIWGLWDHRLPSWLRVEMMKVHDTVFPKEKGEEES